MSTVLPMVVSVAEFSVHENPPPQYIVEQFQKGMFAPGHVMHAFLLSVLV